MGTRLQKFVAFMDEKVPKASCPFCGHESFTVFEDAIYPLLPTLCDNNEQRVAGALPLVIARCDKCGYILLFDAKMTGFYSEENQDGAK